jgi:hypothetical protein|tara:strand:+ start:567 stop:716 length:150 start_codon:yes stop_codon:yes gene_type:complete
MKIIIKHYERTYSIDLGADDIKFEDYMEAIKDISKSIYHEDLINEYWEE